MRTTIFDRARSFVLATWFAAVAILAMAAVPTKAIAQVEDEGDLYAITEFGVAKLAVDVDLGVEARKAFHSEFDKANNPLKTNKQVAADDTVARYVTDLGLAIPIAKEADVQRLGQAMTPPANYIVTGNIVNWKIENVKGGKMATVVMGVIIWDVAASLKVNGASVQGNSGLRPADSSDAVLLQGAVKSAAFNAVQEINKHILPKASILSTLNDTAYVNQGERSGFVKGQRVIIRRKREQVAEGEVKSTDPESCFVTITRSIKGVRPGDKVNAIFVPPVPSGTFNKDNGINAPRQARGGGTGGLGGIFQVILVLGLIGLLFSQGRSGNTDLVQDVTAEADLDNVGQPRVHVSWIPDTFLRGVNESAPVQWQAYRNTETTGPVISIFSQGARDGYDDSALTGYRDVHVVRDATNSSPSLGTCPAFGAAGVKPTTFIAPGVPYRYEVEVVYKINGLSLPIGTNGFCYFVSSRVASSGQATPLIKSTLQNPDDGNTVALPTSFKFTSVRGGNTSVPLKYALQVSTSPAFPAGASTVTFDQESIGTNKYEVVDTATAGGQSLATPAVPFQASFPGVKTLFWRIGAKNILDVPGPVPDPLSGKRYIFSDSRTIKTG
ncbi:MAG: hypothetical protein ABUL72_07340 [Armatimonadota bacterium]